MFCAWIPALTSAIAVAAMDDPEIPGPSSTTKAGMAESNELSPRSTWRA